MNSYTLTELTTYLEEMKGWFSPALHARYIPGALDELIRAVDTDHVGQLKDVTVTISRGKFDLPWDNVGSRFWLHGREYQFNEAKTGRRSMDVRNVNLSGEHTVRYHGFDTDAQGQPCLPAACIPALTAWLEYLVKDFNYNAWGTPRASLPGRPSPAEVSNLRVAAILECDALRGSLNMRTPEQVRQSVESQTRQTLSRR